jgi:hypothetical protein
MEKRENVITDLMNDSIVYGRSPHKVDLDLRLPWKGDNKKPKKAL